MTSSPSHAATPRPKSRLLLAAALLGLALGAIAGAQPVPFSIPAQPAAAALPLFIKQSGTQVTFNRDELAQVPANAVTGTLEPEVALSRLLANTGYAATARQPGWFFITPAGRSGTAPAPRGEASPTEGKATTPQAPAARTGGETIQLEAFTVAGLGVRGSLAKSLELKRQSSTVLDAVSGEDIAVYPDTNIAESLQRISGVTVVRTNGEGELVSIRGLSPQFTLVTAEGLILSSTAISDDGNIQNGRAISLDLFPSQLFAGATVAKTQSAETMDGGLSGAVDLKLPQPFAYAPNTGSVSLQSTYNDLTKRWDPAGSFFWSGKWNGKFGALVQGVVTRDFLYAGIAEGTRWTSFDFPALQATGVEVAQLPRVGEEIYDRTRRAISTTLQFRPTDQFRATVFGVFGESAKERSRVTLQGNLFGPVNPTALVLEGNQAVAATFGAGTQIRSGGDFNAVESDAILVGLTADWQLQRDARVSLKASRSSAKFNREVAALVGQATVNHFTYDFRAQPEYPAMASNALSFTQPGAFTVITNQKTRDVQQDDAFLFSADADQRLKGAFFRSLKVGLEFRTQERKRDTTRANLPIPPASASLASVAGAPRYRYLPDAPAGVPQTFAAFDRGLTYRNLIDPNASVVLPILPALTFGIKEEIAVAYAQTTFEATWLQQRIAGNLGLRYARTQQQANGFSAQGALSTPVKFDRTYDNLLPSLNLRADLNESMVVRFSASRGITRPSLADLAPSETVSAVNPTVTKGNPNLKPYLATQLDLSWEWYFAKESLLSLAVFSKEIDSLIVTRAVVERYVPYDPTRPPGNFVITTPVNGDDATVTGFEANYQQPLSFLPAPFHGLGLLANLTVATSESTSTVVTNATTGVTRQLTTRVQGQSPVSYNAILYYDQGRLQIRAAYHWRDDYLVLLLGQTEQRMKRATGNLDFSINWRATAKLTVFLEALNLTSEDQYLYDRTPSRNVGFADYGRTFNLGVRLKL
jgi:iron complex outermembrane recepter protein